MTIPPRRILLATDFSARSDRAEARALALSEQYDAQLLVLHVVEDSKKIHIPKRIPFSPLIGPQSRLVDNAKRQMLGALRQGGGRARVRIEDGDPAPVILRIAGQEGCDLIVTGVARNEMFGRFTLGKTVDRLLRETEIPLLIVTDRVYGPYRNVVVASDFSEASRLALEGASAFFPQQQLTVLHAHGTPGSYAVDDRDSYREQMRAMVNKEYLAFLNTVQLPDEQRAQLEVLIENGNLLQLLRNLVQSAAIDLVVLGSRNRRLLPDILVGSVAKKVVSDLPCDALVVRSSPS